MVVSRKTEDETQKKRNFVLGRIGLLPSVYSTDRQTYQVILLSK